MIQSRQRCYPDCDYPDYNSQIFHTPAGCIPDRPRFRGFTIQIAVGMMDFGKSTYRDKCSSGLVHSGKSVKKNDDGTISPKWQRTVRLIILVELLFLPFLNKLSFETGIYGTFEDTSASVCSHFHFKQQRNGVRRTNYIFCVKRTIQVLFLPVG